MAMSANTADGEVMVEMNTTPLIDVMLVLLTLLIITLPIQTHAVKLDMPRPQRDRRRRSFRQTVDLGVDFDGTITWNGTAVDRATLDAYLERDRQEAERRRTKSTSIPTGWPSMTRSPWCWPMPSAWARPILVSPGLTSITRP